MNGQEQRDACERMIGYACITGVILLLAFLFQSLWETFCK
jgi:hypothetical protein